MSNVTDNTKTLRRQLLSNGYSPLPNRDKACYLEGWPSVKIDDNALDLWARMSRYPATGIRVENGLCVIDIDIDHPIIDDIADVMIECLPENTKPFRLERHGKGHKMAWFCRTSDIFSRVHTRKWIAPGASADDCTHCIEVFGGASSRQFGSFGPHSHDDDGNVIVSYEWTKESPLDVPLDDLTIVSKEELFDMLDSAEALLQQRGFEPVARSKSGEGVPGKVYDLTPDMAFDLLDGRTVTFDELAVMVKDGYDGRCSASWLEGEQAVNRSRCLVSGSANGLISIWESAGGDTHMPEDAQPANQNKDLIERVAEALKEHETKRRTKLNAGDDHITAAAKLMESYAFIKEADKPIIPLWARRDDMQCSVTNFRLSLMPFCGEEKGPRDGVKKINPVDVWLANPNRIEVAGVRMRPDKTMPTYEDNGDTWINTYRPPDLELADEGSADIGIEFMEQLVPDATERTWFMQWFAYKFLNPAVPGPSLVMVAKDFGTGRGTFGDLIIKLFGQRYVRTVPFDIFAGLVSQAQYTDWAMDSLFALVNESSAAGDLSAYKHKTNVYEHLKEVVEPAPRERYFVRKGVGSIFGVSFCTSLIFTNNPDCLPLPADDRRFAVLRNGKKRDPEFWTRVHAWLDNPANIAAFAEYLKSIDMEGYGPFEAPIKTSVKEEMAAFNITVLDALIDGGLRDMPELFTESQFIEALAEKVLGRRGEVPESWKAIARRDMRKLAHPLRYPTGRIYKVSYRGERETIYTFDEERSDATKHTQARLRSVAGRGEIEAV